MDMWRTLQHIALAVPWTNETWLLGRHCGLSVVFTIELHRFVLLRQMYLDLVRGAALMQKRDSVRICLWHAEEATPSLVVHVIAG